METSTNLNEIISKNIAKNRKRLNMTQLDLAEKLNYSDKAISKWERGDGLPDVNILLQIANIFGITLNDLCYEEKTISKQVTPQNSKIKHIYISLLSFGLVWLIATIAFSLMLVISPSLPKKWLAFIYAIPVSSIVLIALNSTWGKKIWNCLFVSTLIWGCLLSICLSINYEIINWLFLIGVPLQILTIIWYFFKTRIIETVNAIKSHKKKQSNTTKK